MSMTMGMIDCTTENYEEVKAIVDSWIGLKERRKGLSKELIHIVDFCWSNYYGGIKVGFFASIKHDYYAVAPEVLISDFEDLISVLPFSRAILFHEDSGGVTKWFLNTEENIKFYSKNNAIIEPTSYKHIFRQTKGSTHDLPTTKLLDY